MSEQPTLEPQSLPEADPTEKGWFQRLTSVLFILFCFELGLFLLVYPWTDGYENDFAWLLSGHMQIAWHHFWDNSYVRGGLSGLGIVNLWIALVEVFHMFSSRHAPRE